ncbi:hypothetical protein [Sphingopyxis sp.]|uniref:hypothetical protein n=1 Tax=Sphingopyxis sp. TaxID=1908224 RepID=UPI002B46C6B7|nr:hypothetical protein [Sphingopyxis sp.]HJS10966.1 hypothetical protein [Sphingopyxis sp.]
MAVEHLDKGHEQNKAADRTDERHAKAAPRLDQVVRTPAPRDPHSRHCKGEHADAHQHPYLEAERSPRGDQRDLDQRQNAERGDEQPAAPADPLLVVEPQPYEQPKKGRHHDRQRVAELIWKACQPFGFEYAREQIGNDRQVHRDRDARGQHVAVVAPQDRDPQQEQRDGTATNHRVEDQERRHRVLLLQALPVRHRRRRATRDHCAASC